MKKRRGTTWREEWPNKTALPLTIGGREGEREGCVRRERGGWKGIWGETKKKNQINYVHVTNSRVFTLIGIKSTQVWGKTIEEGKKDEKKAVKNLSTG